MIDEVFLPKKNEYMEIGMLTWDRIEEAMRLREFVWEHLENKALFAQAERKDFIKAIEDGFGLVALIRGRVIGCLLCTLRDVEYGVDRRYTGKMLEECADYVDTYIHPEYRGNGIQNILEEIMCGICRQNGKRTILGTVSPDNKHSYENFLKAGYRQVDRMIKYEGLDRIFMEKHLEQEER
ncbi:GNAT family N-acetyltransferase [Lactonifactor longoviformis]|uniref:Acetyltransferase (GNAT) domain-containing protein n=1 Tax=Lactonifactor longoviformis DSM 17459 TaxID=1122155 RepID=A0A1M5BI96_9CLOT|nr:GNAT family N-acetyltransferase [Lactonifactor longoviformis]POP34267.1 GNAT family N-acetyltransferase [Lactonifactor longoviformis]SHF41932.1 Acetyltransferase (GNAT) domain-containing protein [Lactonifactor longoviformis DSM 17459]